MNPISKKYNIWKLNRMQKKVNKEFNKEGLTDKVLEKQIKINKKRNKLNLSDPNTLNDDGWAQ